MVRLARLMASGANREPERWEAVASMGDPNIAYLAVSRGAVVSRNGCSTGLSSLSRVIHLSSGYSVAEGGSVTILGFDRNLVDAVDDGALLPHMLLEPGVVDVVTSEDHAEALRPLVHLYEADFYLIYPAEFRQERGEIREGWCVGFQNV